MFPEGEPRETLRFSGNKINCFPRDQSYVICYIAGEFEAGTVEKTWII